LKSISCWPGATSWCAASISKPSASSAITISRRHSSPRSFGARSKYPAASCVMVVALPSALRWKRKNSASGPQFIS
jgi:hypothetical protein